MLRLEHVQCLQEPRFLLDEEAADKSMSALCKHDPDSTEADALTRTYYNNKGRWRWVDRMGVNPQAEVLVRELNDVLPTIGFSTSAFHVADIEADIQRLKFLDFDESNQIDDVFARLELNLTKAYLRYTMGQGYGFTNPAALLNRLDVATTDSMGTPTDYHRLFDVKMKRPAKDFCQQALGKVTTDSVAGFLASVRPTDSLYRRYQDMLVTATGAEQRRRLLCNMERRRWRTENQPKTGGNYVLVNIPAYRLWAVSPDTVVDMRVVCGAQKTKTPLLDSYLTHMDVNPEWVIPMSIIRGEVSRHAGDVSYFSRHRYYIAERKSGTHCDPSAVSSQMLESGAYKVAQEGGPGNSLGRIIFRFPNKFSVFLHDTSSRGHFNREDRSVSHGCVRVQKPFELARFLLPDADDWLLDKLRISMGMEPETERGREYMADEDRAGNTKLVTWLPVKPRVPVFITYYTLYPDPSGAMQTYPDVYGYDRILSDVLKNFTQ